VYSFRVAQSIFIYEIVFQNRMIFHAQCGNTREMKTLCTVVSDLTRPLPIEIIKTLEPEGCFNRFSNVQIEPAFQGVRTIERTLI
jgi:hypothetical protein